MTNKLTWPLMTGKMSSYVHATGITTHVTHALLQLFPKWLNRRNFIFISIWKVTQIASLQKFCRRIFPHNKLHVVFRCTYDMENLGKKICRIWKFSIDYAVRLKSKTWVRVLKEGYTFTIIEPGIYFISKKLKKTS